MHFPFFCLSYIRSAKTSRTRCISHLPGRLIVSRCERYRVDLCGPSAGLCALRLQQEGRPALMRIPIIGPNQHTGPGGPALHITNESVEPTDRKKYISRERARADLTEDAAPCSLSLSLSVRRGSLTGNGASHENNIFLQKSGSHQTDPVNSQVKDFFYLSHFLSLICVVFSIPTLYSFFLATISPFRFDPCMLHPLIFPVGACVRMLVHRCTWARYLLATLLGLAVGQNNRRALTFPSSPNPAPSLLPRSMSVGRPRICQSGPGQSACCPPAILHLLSHPLFSLLCSVYIHSQFSLVYLSSPYLCIFLYNISSPGSCPHRPLAATVKPLHAVVLVHSSVQYVW